MNKTFDIGLFILFCSIPISLLTIAVSLIAIIAKIGSF